jgi:hypothetical protein
MATHILKMKKLATHLEYPKQQFYMNKCQITSSKLSSKLKTDLLGDTQEETRDTQMCRDTMVENH